MRSVFVLFLAFLLIAAPATAAEVVHVTKTIPPSELQSVMCSDTRASDLPAGSYLAIVYLSGHGVASIDTRVLTPVGYEKIGGNDAEWYSVSPGDHRIMIIKEGYINMLATVLVCDGKVTIVNYDQAARSYPGATTIPDTGPVTAVPVTTTWAGQGTDFPAAQAAAGATTAPGGLGGLSVTTEPPGASIFIDGVQRGISPAVIPDISEGTHTLLLRRDGYQDLSVPVTITPGRTLSFASAMLMSGEIPSAAYGTGSVTTTKKSSTTGPGAVIAVLSICGLLILGKKHS